MAAKLRGNVLIVAAACVLAVPTIASARRATPPAGRNGRLASGGNTCMQCHGSTSGGGMVQILGLPGGYEAGETMTSSNRT